jgi:Protein of unknown function (DUF2785)
MKANRLGIFAALAMMAGTATAGCPWQAQGKDAIAAFKASGFEVRAPDSLESSALAMIDCLAHPDPAIRDGVAYEALSTWLRGGSLDADALRRVRGRLYSLLDGPGGDGFARPFAALVLAEVARTDRIKPWMEADERSAMTKRAADYVASVRDYRGFDAQDGWRHGVAHGADWLMQLTLNPALAKADADRVLAAVAEQAVPKSSHAYVFAEPERLAAPVYHLMRRGMYSTVEWQAWFAQLPPRLGDKSLAYKDETWLARRHDLLGLLASLYVQLDQGSAPEFKDLKPVVADALRQVP